MGLEPTTKRAIAFFDGQNLFHAAKLAFGSTYPDYDPIAMAQALCKAQAWQVAGIRFYTGVPDLQDHSHWHHFWTRKLAALGRRGVFTYSRALRYQQKATQLPDGSQQVSRVGFEKGIDIRIALDIIRLAQDGSCDVVLLFSQDQDFSEVAEEVRHIARQQSRWLKIVSAFPASPQYRNARGINKTDWLKIDQVTYDACRDPRDYRI